MARPGDTSTVYGFGRWYGPVALTQAGLSVLSYGEAPALVVPGSDTVAGLRCS